MASDKDVYKGILNHLESIVSLVKTMQFQVTEKKTEISAISKEIAGLKKDIAGLKEETSRSEVSVNKRTIAASGT